ncbi:DUF2637 domain-containing protein [Marinitenerispora sediminis]|uniref:DUF2637 domain-containing protein n=1 Tax=Marinitenerispora sediminis TaxID=1931232 RepID=A0A368T5P4_9ACTN|nr:hypothetical protein [Marinitenerispora sediminis]RCV50686.1 hypothetical protein DEF28_17370 [Marinitenerispora sediminis]RCV56361.1 hypothetical protein DEF23_12650 [Marinitenerispora sediminis]RCV58696.1 hypothetical protein DEF24_12480 [Marinitenerispora sediminis]
MTDRIAVLFGAASSIPPSALAVAALAAVAVLLGVLRTVAAATNWLRGQGTDRRANLLENLLVGWFVAVVAGLIMQGLTDFARHDMGLTGPWPYLLFCAFDGMAALFAVASYRWSQQGASPLFPRAMVVAIMAASAWFQWEHAAGRSLAARVAWAVLPLIAAVLWEFVLVQRRRAWKIRQAPSVEAIPRARWLLAPLQSMMMKRRMVLWGITSYHDAVELHVTRVEAIRRLRRHFGILWAWRVPADVAYQLRAGVRIPEAAARIDGIIAAADRQLVLDVGDVFADLAPLAIRPGEVAQPRHVRVPVTPPPADEPYPQVLPALYSPAREPAAGAGLPPERDPAVFKRAVEDYRLTVALGAELPSERRLCAKYGVPATNRRWARKIIEAATAVVPTPR